MHSERLFQSPDSFDKKWETKWPKVGIMDNGDELRADCALTQEECLTILNTGELLGTGMVPHTTNQLYEVRQLPGHFGDARVMRIVRLG